MFIDEAIRHPFAQHDDLIDACARIYDMKPLPPTKFERQSTESIDMDVDDMPGVAVQ